MMVASVYFGDNTTNGVVVEGIRGFLLKQQTWLFPEFFWSAMTDLNSEHMSHKIDASYMGCSPSHVILITA